ncbi:MAG TPA: ATP-binding protein [Anaeromyxobacteraceae bacterium]|nr:ATP-binding protein [Anaeromyxobacteraceae bacterium]
MRVAHIGIFDHDQRTDTIYWSPKQREIYGIDAEELVTLQLFLDHVYPADRERIDEAVRAAHTPGGDGLFDVEHRITRRDGAVRWLKTRSQTFFEGEGEGRRPVRTVGAVIDITDTRRAEEERERLRTLLAQAQKLESVGLLAGGVAHEFNNMLAVILGNAEMLQSPLAGDPAASADLSEIVRAAGQARDVTRQLLAFSRKQIVSPQPLSPNLLLARIRSTLARLIGEDVDLRFLPGPEVWSVEMDHSQFEQVLVNLAVNARDAMPRGGTLTVETANVQLDEEYCRRNPGFRPGDYVLVAVSDTGVGMDPETLERVFEPFFTTKPLGKGTGLGLATVHGIVTQCGGTVHVYSEPGIGSTFKIHLPRLRAEQEVTAARDAAPAVVGSGTVLLVEDEPMVRRMTAAMLASLGLSVLAAESPGDALEQAARKDTRIDLLLTDVVMPGMSGKELRDRILALRPDLPVLFMSGYTPDVISHHGVLEAGVHLLQKPFSIGHLTRAIGEARKAR